MKTKSMIKVGKKFCNNFQVGLMLALVIVMVYYEVFIVLPMIVKQWTVPYLIHIFNASFIMLNVVGNWIYGMITDTSIKGKCEVLRSVGNPEWPTCAVCLYPQPPRAWHCRQCDTCIVTRDHHCVFWSCCVGYFNRRYFAMFTFYLFIAITYCSYYNIKFLSKFLMWNRDIISKFAMPLVCFIREPRLEYVYIVSIIFNVLLVLLTGSLFLFHFHNILSGKIISDTKHAIMNNKSINKSWKSNLVEVFGIRWYLAWLLPFIHSPLPGNGIELTDKNKCN